jgi:hypothetical protein
MSSEGERAYDRLIAESQAVHEMPGRLAIARVAMVERINEILRGNVVDLVRLIRRMNEDFEFSLQVLDRSRPERHGTFLGECERLLHNALAGVQSRVSLLRTFVNRHIDTPLPELGAEYRSRIDATFKNDDLHKFLVDLRNYILHERLPVATTTESIAMRPDGSMALDFKLNLTTKVLVESRQWSAVQRAWILNHGDNLDIVALLQRYYATVVDFDAWLVAAINHQCADDIAEYQAAAHAFNAKWYG